MVLAVFALATTTLPNSFLAADISKLRHRLGPKLIAQHASAAWPWTIKSAYLFGKRGTVKFRIGNSNRVIAVRYELTSKSTCEHVERKMRATFGNPSFRDLIGRHYVATWALSGGRKAEFYDNWDYGRWCFAHFQ